MSKKVGSTTGPDSGENAFALTIACNLDVFSKEDNKRHEILLNEVLAAIREVREAKYGYMVSFSPNDFLTIAEWISLEKLCCPFLSFQIGFSSGDEPLWVTLTGPKGTKEFLMTFFNAPMKLDRRFITESNDQD